MLYKRVGMVGAVASFVGFVLVGEVRPQSVAGASTVEFVKIGEGAGSGTPKGNVTAAASFVNGVPVGVFRVRWAGFASATIDVNCIYYDGDRIVIGGPVRSGVTFHPSFRHIYLVVEDNGRPVDGESVDRALAFATNIDFCADADFLIFYFDLLNWDRTINGNFTIRDDTTVVDARPQPRRGW